MSHMFNLNNANPISDSDGPNCQIPPARISPPVEVGMLAEVGTAEVKTVDKWASGHVDNTVTIRLEPTPILIDASPNVSCTEETEDAPEDIPKMHQQNDNPAA